MRSAPCGIGRLRNSHRSRAVGERNIFASRRPDNPNHVERLTQIAICAHAISPRPCHTTTICNSSLGSVQSKIGVGSIEIHMKSAAPFSLPPRYPCCYSSPLLGQWIPAAPREKMSDREHHCAGQRDDQESSPARQEQDATRMQGNERSRFAKVRVLSRRYQRIPMRLRTRELLRSRILFVSLTAVGSRDSLQRRAAGFVWRHRPASLERPTKRREGSFA